MPADYTIMRRIRFFENLAVMPHIFSPVQTVFYFFAIGIVIRQGKFHRTDNRLNPLPFFLPIGNCNRTDTVHAPDKRIKEYIIRDTAVFDNREVYPKKVTFPPSRLRDLSGTLRIRGQFATQIITGSRRIADDMSGTNYPERNFCISLSRLISDRFASARKQLHAPLFRNPSFLSPKDRDRKEGTKSENRTSTSFI